MKSHQLLAAIPGEIVTEILEYNFANDKKLYRVALEAVAQRRKLRPVFLERQPRASRHATMAMALTAPGMELAADSLVRNWLLKKHNSLLTDFLDALKIPHEKGAVENLPASVEDAQLQAAVDTILSKYPPEIVSIYLNAFTDMNETRWPNLETLLQNDPRLKLQGQTLQAGSSPASASVSPAARPL
jgi:hypothetical protein